MTHKKNKNSKHNKKIKHNNKGYKNVVFIVVFVLLSIIIIKSKFIERNYKTTQIILNNENITNKMFNSLIFENSQIYMSYDDIKEFLDKTLYTESQTGLVVTSSNRKIAVINEEEQTLKVNGSNVEVKDITIKKDEKLYIAISEMKSVYNFELEKIDKTNTIIIDMLDKKRIKAYVTRNVKIKKETRFLSANIDEVKKGNWIYFISDEKKYAKVRTQNGIIGYVKNKALTNYINERDDFLEKTKSFKEENAIIKDISKEDISTFEKRQNIINKILQQTIKNDKMYVHIFYNGDENMYFERFKIEIVPILKECGIEIEFQTT